MKYFTIYANTPWDIYSQNYSESIKNATASWWMLCKPKSSQHNPGVQHWEVQLIETKSCIKWERKCYFWLHYCFILQFWSSWKSLIHFSVQAGGCGASPGIQVKSFVCLCLVGDSISSQTQIGTELNREMSSKNGNICKICHIAAETLFNYQLNLCLT